MHASHFCPQSEEGTRHGVFVSLFQVVQEDELMFIHSVRSYADANISTLTLLQSCLFTYVTLCLLLAL